MKKTTYAAIFMLMSTIIISCMSDKELGKAVAPLFQGVTCINKFYQESNRLPTDNNELTEFASKNKMLLDLSKFKIFTFYMSSDSTYTIDYEIDAEAKGHGSFTVNIKKIIN